MKVSVGAGGGVKVGVGGAGVSVGGGVAVTTVTVGGGALGVGVRLGRLGCWVVGMGVRVGKAKVAVGRSDRAVGEGVSLGVGVVNWPVAKVGNPVAVDDGVTVLVKAWAAAQGATPASPMLYASNASYSCLPCAMSTSVGWLPAGCC